MVRFQLGAALLGVALAACGQVEFNELGRPCDDGKCADGYECRPDTNICVPELARGCSGSGVCWSEITVGDTCEVEGAYVSCDAQTDCSGGCRTCRDEHWSACLYSDCEVGTVEHCSQCGDNCNETVLNATAACGFGTAACDYVACDGGVDVDGDRTNGCECVPAGVEVCDGVDNDCSGTPDDASFAALQSECSTLHANVHVATWACTGECAVETCEPGWRDVDGLVANGCEVDCLPTVPPDEVCDGVDNDCDGATDDLAQGPLDAQCSSLHAGALAVQGWSCTAGACAAACVANNWDINGLPADGCEYACVSQGVEICNGADDDCDGDTDGLDTDLDTAPEVNAACAAQHSPGTNVTSWACGSGACSITGCATDRWHNDASLSNGCEYVCVFDGAEVCDGEDDDCDGAIDGLDSDLDETVEVNADCAVFYPSAVDVQAWVCADSACDIAECVGGTTDLTGGVADGCETTCTVTNGGIETCDGVDNDCNGTADDLQAAAAATECNGRHPAALAVQGWSCSSGACVPACTADNWNENGTPDDGCEYACVFDGPEVCDGEDDDCDGETDSADTDLDTPGEVAAVCSVQHAPGTDVTGWGCSAGACQILSCSGNTWHIDSDLSNGCEYACTEAGVETCNGDDDDCDGATDAADSDLDELAEIDGDCAGQYGAALQVEHWACGAGACGIDSCNADFYHYDSDLTNGCEYSCAQSNGGTEICDNIDNDCDGTTDDALGNCRCADGINPPAAVETCDDGVDDTCDGAVDEGCPCLGTQTFTISAAGADCRVGTTDVTVLALQLDSDCDNALASLVVDRHPSSTLADGEVTNIRLYDDVDASGDLSAGDVQLGSPVPSLDGQMSFAALSLSVAAGATRHVIVVLDATADGWFAARIVDLDRFGLTDTNQGRALQGGVVEGGAHALVASRLCDGSANTPADLGLGSFSAASLTQVTAPGTAAWAAADEGAWTTGTTYVAGLADCDLQTQTPVALDTRISDHGTVSEFLHIDTGVPLGLPLCGLTMRAFGTVYRPNQGGRCDAELFSDFSALWTYAYDGASTVDVSSVVQTAGSTATVGPSSADCTASEWIDIDLGATYAAAGTSGSFEVRLIAEGDGAIDTASDEVINGITEIYLRGTPSP